MTRSVDREAIKDWIRRFQSDPALFVRKVFKAEPSEQQLALLDHIADPNARVAIGSGVSTGKTTSDAWLVWWHVICHPHSKCAVTAPTKSQLQDALVAECALWKSRMHPWFAEQVDLTSERAYVKPPSGGDITQFATFKTSSKHKPEALQGLHADYVLALVDEASGVDDAVYEPLRGATGTHATRALFTSNPTRPAGYFHRVMTSSATRDRWTRLFWSSWDSPHAPKAELEDIRKEYGETSDMYRVRVLGMFPSASPRQLISTDLALAQSGKHLREEEYNWSPVVLGVDVAWEGDDRSAVYLRQGLYSKLLFESATCNTLELADRVSRFIEEYNAQATFVDAGPVGAGTIDRLRQLGHSPIPVNFGGTSPDPVYSNMRTYMWVKLKEWLESGGVIEDSEKIRQDLTAPEYYPAGDCGKMILERKVDMKKRTLFSTDLGDALALTLAAPVVNSSNRVNKKPVMTNSSWDPLGS